MANKKINGITIAINADTNGVTAGLKDLTDESISLTKQLKSVESLLKMDPGNTDLIATQQKLLADNVETTRKKLEALKAAQEDVKAAVSRGDIGTEEYIAFQKELVTTEKRLKDLEHQSEDTGEEVDDLGKETKQTGNEMEKTEKQSGKLGETLKDGLAAGAKIAAASIAAMAAAAVATVAGLVNAAGAAAEYGDNIDKMSQKLGMSSDAYQEWDFVMQHAGSDIDKMTTSMKKLAESVQDPSKDAAAAFKKLGTNVETLREMSEEEIFETVISGLQDLESGTERTALATTLLGKSAMDLGALLNMSAEETAEMRQQVHDLGGVMSEDAVKTSAQYQDSLQNVKTAIGGVTREIGGSFMPSMIKMMDSVAQIASGNLDAIDELEDGLQDFMENLEDNADKIADAADKFIQLIIDELAKSMPKLIESGLKIVKTLANALINNLPLIIDSGGKILLELVQSLIKELPRLIKVGLEVITKLAQGIAEALPTLIPQIIEIVTEIVQILTDPKNLMPLIEAAFAIITALINGLLSPESLNKMIEMLPQIVENIVDILIDSIDLLLDAAVALIEALCDYFFEPQNLAKIVQATFKILVKIAEGIIAAVWKVGEAVQAINDKIIDKLAENWERLKQAGRDLLDSIMNGVKEKWDEWTGWWENIGGWIYDKLHPDGGDLFDFGGGDEPAMATGGIVTAPTRALIGENGAEAILPLESNTHWMDILAAKIAGAGGAGVTIGEINVDVHGADGASNIGYTIVSKIDEALRSYQIQQARGYGGSGIG